MTEKREVVGCCPDGSGDAEIEVFRVVFADPLTSRFKGLARKRIPLTNAVLDFKAISKKNGVDRIAHKSEIFSKKIETKANVGRQIASSIGSALLPGDISPFRSPVRSAFWRTVTPGGGRGGSRRGENRGYRCPEGYQYGGRFTDSRLSTCGQKLFDIPSPLRAIADELRGRGTRVRFGPKTTGTPLGAGEIPEDPIQRRKPQIPKVSAANSREAQVQIKNMVSDISGFDGLATRMVRRDGFVLEPVVPASVLRAIPDNRDMEGATYISSIAKPGDIGKDELGLLSNTGVVSLVYILPNGSTLTLEKARKLSVGERRKLGRTVNSAIDSSNSGDAASRLKMVASETGDGIKYTENLKSVKTVADAFKKGKRAKAKPQQEKPKIEEGQKITSVENAIEHLAAGGSLSDIAPKIMDEVLSKSKDIQARRLSANQRTVEIGDEKYFLYTRPERYQHIAERFASDVQQGLGLLAPSVIFAEGPNERRQYLRQDVERISPNAALSPGKGLSDIPPEDVAAIMISDFLTDQRERPNTSIYPVEVDGKLRGVLAENTSSGLIDLSDIEITERTRMNIKEFYEAAGIPNYSEYYSSLKEQQRDAFDKYLAELIKRARDFKINEIRKRMNRDGMSEGEKTHLAIISTLFSNRLERLSDSKNLISEIFGG
jgi:hypothetical protein